ncbi:hypothetical protein DFJ77DRAFT_465116 [Powellomyces hirtus]|nr:hypothetical protein DFJ77DRAFT_465116 [Powellomyces hirtus]
MPPKLSKLAAALTALDSLLAKKKNDRPKGGRKGGALTSASLKAPLQKLATGFAEAVYKEPPELSQINTLLMSIRRWILDPASATALTEGLLKAVGGFLLTFITSLHPVTIVDKILDVIQAFLDGGVDKGILGAQLVSPLVEIGSVDGVQPVQQKQVLEILNQLMTKCNPNKAILMEKSFLPKLKGIARQLSAASDIEVQIKLTELLFRLCPKSHTERQLFAKSLELPVALAEIRAEQFHQDVRTFINLVNAQNDGVISFPRSFRVSRIECVVGGEHVPLMLPSSAESFWFDFNLHSIATSAALENVSMNHSGGSGTLRMLNAGDMTGGRHLVVRYQLPEYTRVADGTAPRWDKAVHQNNGADYSCLVEWLAIGESTQHANAADACDCGHHGSSHGCGGIYDPVQEKCVSSPRQVLCSALQTGHCAVRQLHRLSRSLLVSI